MTTTTTIQKWGNSQGIRIPKSILKQINLDTDSDVSITVKDNCIIIKKAIRKHIPLAERFSGYTGKAPKGEYDWGEPQGKEIW